MKYKTNYEAHDEEYQRRKASGLRGWDDDEDEIEKLRDEVLSMVNSAEIKTGSLGLDLGCGAGNVAIFLAKNGYKMHGVDISKTAIQWAEETALQNRVDIQFKTMDITKDISSLDKKYDFIVDSHCLHCIIGDDRKKLLNNIKAILKKDGFVIISTMCQPISRDKMQRKKYIVSAEGVYTRYIGKHEEILNEFRESNFEILKYYVDESDDGTSDLIVLLRKI